MSRSLAALAVLAVLLWAEGFALADRREPPVLFEIGLNTRRFSTGSNEMIAFRAIGPLEQAPSGSAVTASLRFTKQMRWNTFAGVEAETGMLAERGSNVAGAYALLGGRGDLGPLDVLVEVAPGKRWIRYGLQEPDHTRWMVETRVRGEMWLSSRFTVGAAIGSTLGDIDVWMAGLYVGVHSLDFGRGRP